MADLEIGPNDRLHYEYDPPADGKPTFVFVNALTGNAAAWQAVIGPALREGGYGTLAYNFRGQELSRFSPEHALTPDLTVNDLVTLLRAVAPPRPVLVGLSIGGLYAARAWLQGADAEALVLINTLRRPGPRIDWINEAMARAVATGGFALLLDMLLPMLVNEDKLAEMRTSRLTDAPYEPLDPAHGHMNLMRHAGEADWDLPYERLSLPVLVATGLQDRVFLDREDVRALTARLPDVQTVELAEAGHLIPMERPGETVAFLRTFAERALA